jgi:adenylyltransferase and sulfurtransferase
MQALEAIKIAAGVGEPLSGRMLLFDALSARVRIVCQFTISFSNKF